MLILEKVFAKFCGSYHALAGGNAIWALKAMTGDQIFSFMHKGGKWERNELVHIESKHSKRAVGYRATKDQLSETDMFDMCKHYYERESILAASSLSGTDSKEESKQGLVQGHAYTVVELKEVGGFRMICLRNPWGSFEWTGSWSDSSILWDKNPKVKKACKPDLDHTNDGMFWMEWSDFSSNFRKIDICARSTGIKDLELDLNEEAGCIGPCKGCFQGCLGYYLCCRGCKAFCCAKEAVFDDDHSEFVSIKVDKGEVQRSEPAAKSSNPFA